jgi:hypothetical protein
MKTRTRHALAALRAADPVGATNTETLLQDHPLPDLATEPAFGKDDSTRRRNWLYPVIGVAAVIALVVVGITVTRVGDGSNATSSTTTSAPGSDVEAQIAAAERVYRAQIRQRQVATQTMLTGLLATFPLPPASRRLSVSPIPELAQDRTFLGDSDVVDVPTWFTVKVNLPAVISFVKTHPATGFTLSGSGFGATFHSFEFLGPATADAQNVSIDVSLMAGGDGVVGRIDGVGTTVVPRDPKTIVPANASADIIVTRNKSFDSRDTITKSATNVTGANVSHLISVVNGLAPSTEGVRGCGASTTIKTDVVTFHSHGHAYVLGLDQSGCAGASISVDGGSQYGLVLTNDLGTAILSVLGLPADY